MFGEPPDPNLLTRDQIFDCLAEHGVAAVNVEFSGGNDSGSIDGYDFVMADNDAPAWAPPRLDWSQTHERYSDPDRPHWIRYRLRSNLSVEQRLEHALGQPIFDTYGSFAGDYYVSGTVMWDVAERSVVMRKSEQVWSDEQEDYV